MADPLTFQPLSFEAFNPALDNLRQQAQQKADEQNIANGIAQFRTLGSHPPAAGAAAPAAPLGQAAPAQGTGAAQAGPGAAPGISPTLSAAVDQNPALLAKLLNSPNPAAQSVGQILLQRSIPLQRAYGFTMAPDGTLLRTDPTAGTATEVYKASKPKEFIKLDNGEVVAADTVAGTVTPAYQGKPKAPPVPAGYEPVPGGGLQATPGGPQDRNRLMADRAKTAVEAGLKPGTPEFKTYLLTEKLPEGGLSGGNNPYATGKFNEGQGKAATYADRMAASDAVITDNEGLNNGTGGWIAGVAQNNVPDGAFNQVASPERQQATQAQRDFVNAVLRRESGAAISPSEFENAKKQYFPQPGDSPQTIAQKRENRRISTEGIMREAGPAYVPPAVWKPTSPSGKNTDRAPQGDPMARARASGASRSDAQAGQYPVVSTPQEAAALPSGTVFQTPDGRVKRVP